MKKLEKESHALTEAREGLRRLVADIAGARNRLALVVSRLRTEAGRAERVAHWTDEEATVEGWAAGAIGEFLGRFEALERDLAMASRQDFRRDLEQCAQEDLKKAGGDPETERGSA